MQGLISNESTSRTGFTLNLGPKSGAVQCYSKTQEGAAVFSQNAEFIAMKEAARSVLHIRMLLEDLGHPMVVPTTVWKDNVGCTAFANETRPLSKTKHSASSDRLVLDLVQDDFGSWGRRFPLC